MLVPGSRDPPVCILFASLLVGLAASQTVCPSQCACHDVTVDCRFRSVSRVADIAHLLPPEVEQLDLGENEAVSALNRSSFPLLTRLRRLRLHFKRFINFSQAGSVAEWLACWTQAQKGLGSNRSRDAVG